MALEEQTGFACGAQVSEASRWHRHEFVTAIAALGWDGQIGEMTEFRGTRFLAVIEPSENPRGPGDGWLVGCLVPGFDATSTMQDASLLAPYSRRAVLLPNGCNLAEIALRAAVLDQGVVLAEKNRFTTFAAPGPVSHSPLQHCGAWQDDTRWQAFVRVVRESTDQLAAF